MLLSLLVQAAIAAPLSVSFYAPYGYQPGLRLALEAPLGDGSLFVRPRAGGFTRPHNHITAEIGADVGLRRHGERWTHAVAVGGGYLAASQVQSVSVDLGSGATSKTRVLRHQAVPALSLEIGRPMESLTPFARASGGWKFAETDVPFFAVELGLQMGGM